MLRILLLTVCGGILFVFHGLSFHLTPWSQAFFNAIAKYTYGTAGQQQITVLIFREANLDALGVSYPVPRRTHAEVLDGLAAYRPKAVFVDFVFVDRREQDEAEAEALKNALCNLRRNGTAVFLADARTVSGSGVAPAFFTCADRVSAVVDETEGVSGVLTYAPYRHTAGARTPSAAFAMAGYAAAARPSEAENLEIIWGNGVAPLNRKWMDCEVPALWTAVRAVLSHGPLALKKDCPYSRSLSVVHLLQTAPGDDADVSEALTGKYVLYGAAFDFVGDRIASPVYGDLPGVFLHAMALDNLFTFGTAYKRAEHAGLSTRLVDLALLLAAASLLVLFPRCPTPHAEHVHQFTTRLQWAVVALIVGAGGLALTYTQAGLEAAVLLALCLYFAYQIIVRRDRGLLIFVLIVAVTGTFAYTVLNLGPRNLLAYLAFFEVVRHGQGHLREAAEHWRNLPAAERSRATGKNFWTVALLNQLLLKDERCKKSDRPH